ncbi:MAG: hypothetical protein KBT33_12280 [Prevotellaceae bacterium]|nr:hypothetical protein [Candidatus Minthosoma equi]
MENSIGKGRILSEKQLEIIVAIFLGVTALFSAWASWIGSLHGGNQVTNYTLSNNLASEGNSEYVADLQHMNADMSIWGQISTLMVDEKFSPVDNSDKLAEKAQYLLSNANNEGFIDAVVWAMDETEKRDDGSIVSPFEKDGLVESYFVDADSLISESQAVLEQGKQDNSNGDAYNLVTVIYTVVLFLLGIVGTLKMMPNREILLGFSILCFLIATIYMFTIPMPTGFSLLSFF